MFKNKTKPETKVTKKEGEHTEVGMCWNIFNYTQDALMGKNDEFKRNYLLAIKTISSEGPDLVKIRRIIDSNEADSIAIRTLYQKCRDLFNYYLKENLNVMVSSVISMMYDFVVNKMNFNEHQLKMFRSKFYTADTVLYNPYSSSGRYGNEIFNDMLNQINRRILMVVDSKDETLSEKDNAKCDRIDRMISGLGFESISMNYANSFVLELYDYIFCNLISIAAFDTETMTEGKYPMLLNFIDDFLNDICAEIKKMYMEIIYGAMYPYLEDQEFGMVLGVISNANMGGCTCRQQNTVNVYPEPDQIKSMTDHYHYTPSDNGYKNKF